MKKVLGLSLVVVLVFTLFTGIAAPVEKLNVTLDCAIEAGNIGYAFKTYGVPWGKEQGIKFNLTEFPTGEMYSLLLMNFISGGGTYDLFMYMLNYRGDFTAGGFCYPLDEPMEKWGYPAADDILPAYRKLQKWGDKTHSFIIDGDMRTLYVRKDLFAKYGITVPETWNEFLEVAKKMTMDTNGDGEVDLWGTAFMGVRPRNFWDYLDRWVAYNGPDPHYFDPITMEPLINTAGSVKALENLVETVKYSPPGVLSYEWRERIDDWAGGRLAMLMGWGDAFMFGSDPSFSQITDKIGCAPPPGVFINGKLHRRALLAANWALALTSTVPPERLEAAYKLIRYLNGPEGSLKVVTDPQTACSPFRYTHYESPKFRNLFRDAGQFLDNYRACVEIGYPDLHLPGASRFTDALALYVAKACAGEMSAKEALDACAKAWKESVRILGKDQLLKIYRDSMGLSPLKQ